MDNRNTLRSQTVRCAHCGEYYSVTYDYCPFCDAGRKEAEKKKGSLLGGLLGNPEPEKKKKPRSQSSDKTGGRDSGRRAAPRRRDEEGWETGRVGRETGRIPPVSRETGRIPPVSRETGRIPPVSRETGRIPPVSRETGRIPPVGRETGRIPPVGRETGRIPPVGRDTGRIPQERKETVVADEPPRRRKKISEMTEEERAANRAQREARAAQRKRERERAAAEAAAKAAQKEAAAKAARAAEQGEAPGPVFETMTPPPSFGFEPDSETHTQPTGHPEEDKSASGIIRTITIPLKGAGLAAAVAAAAELAETAETGEGPQQPTGETQETAEAPTPPAPGEEELAQSQWAFMRDLEQSSSETVVEVGSDLNDFGKEKPAPEEKKAVPAEEPEAEKAPAAAQEDGPQAAPEAPEAQEAAPAKEAAPAQGAAPAKGDALLETKEAAEPTPPPKEADVPQPSITEDALFAGLPLSASRRMNRVPPPPPPEGDATQDSQTQGDPDIIIPKIETEEDLDNLLAEIREILAEDSPGAAHAKASEEATTVFAPQLEVDEPTKPIPVLPKKGEAKPWQLPPEEKETPEKDAPLEEIPDEVEEEDEEEEDDDEALFLDEQPGKKKKKKSGFQVAMLALSIVIIAVAGFIVVRNLVPALQTGIFAGWGKGGEEEGQVDTAQTFILNQKDMVFSEPGMTADLVPTFAPVGSTAQLSWSSSNSAVASVDENGKVTTLSPGETTIVASMASGQSAQCQVRCNWTVDGDGNVTPAQPEGEQPQEGAATGEPALSETNVSLDSPGGTRQLTLNGATGEVSWSSSKHAVATVDQSGTITAVAIGGATITATCDGKTYTCEVRCVW